MCVILGTSHKADICGATAVAAVLDVPPIGPDSRLRSRRETAMTFFEFTLSGGQAQTPARRADSRQGPGKRCRIATYRRPRRSRLSIG
nr:hypothetical protein CFP56_56998 [Quercus suber]